MQIHSRAVLISALLAAAACSSAEPGAQPFDNTTATPPTPRARVLATVPELDRSLLIDTTGSDDAEQKTWRVLLPLDSVRMFYRRMLPNFGWRIVNDESDSTVVNLYMEKDSMVLWIRAVPSGSSTNYTLIGSRRAVDSTKTR